MEKHLQQMAAFCAVVASLCCLAATSQATLITTLYNTGVNASGSPLPDGTTPDPNYSLVSVPSGSSATLVRTSAGGFPIGPWIADDSLSAWIKPSNGTANLDTDPVGNYTFQTTFNLTGFDPSSASILGQWATDNEGISIVLNGITIVNGAAALAANLSNWTPFTISSGFVSGVNVLDFTISNLDNGGYGNPTGLRVEMTGSATPVPEPTTMVAGALLLLPFGASTLRMFRKSRTA
jgi:hypothetical protein